MEDYPIGIDLGTSNSLIGVYENGDTTIIPNQRGERVTPSIVTILDIINENDSQNIQSIIVGEEALDKIVENSSNSIQKIKRFIGKKYSDIEKEIKTVSYKIIKAENDLPKVEIKGKNGKTGKFSPEEISSFIIKKMIKNAERYLHHKVRKIVITCPANFTDGQRELTKQAAEAIEGVEVLRVINEPTAAALAYGLDKNQKNENKKILVFDLGGGTFDVTILEIHCGQDDKSFEVKSTSSVPDLGGDDFDEKLKDYFLKNFCEKQDIKEDDMIKDEKNKKILFKLKIESENIKRILSKSDETTLCINNFYEGKDLEEIITRKEFESISKDLFDKLSNAIDNALKDAKIEPSNPSEINEVIMIGGSSRIPKVKEILQKKFGAAKINDSINPDEAVAKGATFEAAKLLFKNDPFVSKYNLQDTIPLSLGTEIANKDENKKNEGMEMSVIIKKGERIPIERKKIYQTSDNKQKGMKIGIYEGENKYVKYNHLLGDLRISGLTEKDKGKVKVEVTFSVDINGVLSVSATEIANEKDNRVLKEIVLDKHFNVSKEEMTRLMKRNDSYYKKISKEEEPEINYLEIANTLSQYTETYNKSTNNDEKYNTLVCYNDALTKFIDKFNTDFDNAYMKEKYYQYVKQLFMSYSNTFKAKEKIKIKKGEEQDILDIEKDIIDNTNKYLKVFKSQKGYLEKLIGIIENIPKDKFYPIVINVMKFLKNCGDEWIKKNEKFRRYRSLMYFEQVTTYYKKYLSGDKLKNAIKEQKIINECEDIYEYSQKEVDNINANAHLVLKAAENSGNLVSCGSGDTNALRYLMIKEGLAKESYEILLANYEKVLREIQSQKERNPTEEEAICLANIIKLNHNFLGYTNYDRYIILADKCEKIISDLGLEPNSKSWLKDFRYIVSIIQKEKNKVE